MSIRREPARLAGRVGPGGSDERCNMDAPPLVLLLNLESRPDRLGVARGRCEAAGLSPIIHPATTPDDLVREGATWDASLAPGAAACLASHLRMMHRFIESDAEWAMILEDDVLFFPGFASRFQRAVESLPIGWDFLQVGWLPTDTEASRSYALRSGIARSTPLRYAAHFIRPSIHRDVPVIQPRLPAFGTHAYLISRRFARRFVVFETGPAFAPIDFMLRFSLEASHASELARLSYWRCRNPLAGQDWSMGSDIDSVRFGHQVHQMDERGRRRSWPSLAAQLQLQVKASKGEHRDELSDR